MTQGLTKCKWCSDDIAVGRIKSHEKLCAKWTDVERDNARLQRIYARRHSEKNGHVPTKSVRESNKRIRLQVSLDFESFRKVIMQLAPSFSIDKVEVS